MDESDQPAPRGKLPSRAEKWIEWCGKKAPWWKHVRTLLLMTEAGFVLTKHEAPAGVARAFVVVGDVIFKQPDQR